MFIQRNLKSCERLYPCKLGQTTIQALPIILWARRLFLAFLSYLQQTFTFDRISRPDKNLQETKEETFCHFARRPSSANKKILTGFLFFEGWQSIDKFSFFFFLIRIGSFFFKKNYAWHAPNHWRICASHNGWTFINLSIFKLCFQIRQFARPLVDGFGIPDGLLGPIASVGKI